MPLSTRLLLGPYYIGAAISWMWFRSREPWQQVGPNHLIGRWLDREESAGLLDEGVVAVLDLSAEYPAPRALLRLPYCNIQILDMTPPTVEQLHAASDFIAEWSAKGHVFVHCAMGYTRSATVAAAHLLASGSAKTVEEALTMIRSSRAGIRIRSRNERVLHRFVKSLSQRLALDAPEAVVVGSA